jgi:hypothetical protein
MFEKSGKYYADWRDRNGKRLRKSFRTPRAALQYEAEQKELTHPKPRAHGQHSPKSFAPHGSARKPAPATTRRKQPKPSSPKLVQFRRTN